MNARGGSGPDRVGELLAGLLQKWGLDRELARQEAVGRWGEVVGARIASVTRARSVAGGILFVEVRSSAWLNELNLMRRELISRLNAGTQEGRVDRIIFTLSEDAQ